MKRTKYTAEFKLETVNKSLKKVIQLQKLPVA
jgi:hypothetical protein